VFTSYFIIRRLVALYKDYIKFTLLASKIDLF